MAEPLVSTDWLHKRLQAPDIAILDCSWHLPSSKRDAGTEFLAAHIPGAHFFDIDAQNDGSPILPHMLPKAEAFASRMRRLGIGDGKHVVCYDSLGLFSAARVWWMFRVFGHEDVSVLDGGLPKWIREGKPVEEGEPPRPQERHFTARFQAMMVKDMTQMRSALQIVDARSPSRFRGEEAEPRQGVRPGHIPGARNLHYAALLNGDGTMKSAHDIEGLFKAAGIDVKKPVVTSCGSGVTAAILTLGLTLAEGRGHSLYDGSWAEWGATQDNEIETGPPR